MLWLFGQIWLWLLAAFVLGAAAGALVMRRARRPAPPPVQAEQTQWLPRPPDEYVDPEQPDRGHRSGTLPIDWPPSQS
ncbi:hypothetical protein [Amycolatopsis alkalitolerans]|uniref:Uncharacterized protein n=1 Tax=Amycolatopsis alkalitolerans TaxID=2547244 RepID=A0A5C4M4Q1_9PSEU|nr:hypothetical protein [Amycolatopsis alkalitolerans]TNC28078.1 hypothetical protein FG385_06515 [Amycolatopsis alkalitolerans]